MLEVLELSQVYNHIFADEKPAIRFLAEHRSPRLKSQFVTMKLSEENPDKTLTAEDMVTFEVRCDLTPLAGAVFLELCTGDRPFTITYGDAKFTRRTVKPSAAKTHRRNPSAGKHNWQNGTALNGHGGEMSFPVENRLLSNVPDTIYQWLVSRVIYVSKNVPFLVAVY